MLSALQKRHVICHEAAAFEVASTHTSEKLTAQQEFHRIWAKAGHTFQCIGILAGPNRSMCSFKDCSSLQDTCTTIPPVILVQVLACASSCSSSGQPCCSSAGLARRSSRRRTWTSTGRRTEISLGGRCCIKTRSVGRGWRAYGGPRPSSLTP